MLWGMTNPVRRSLAGRPHEPLLEQAACFDGGLPVAGGGGGPVSDGCGCLAVTVVLFLLGVFLLLVWWAVTSEPVPYPP